ncbi:MAG TPA: hypothetical protein VMJ32_07755, partial [Pirellulales bacterium]|nr:hypothetical protein [Pirellulales bacterium]
MPRTQIHDAALRVGAQGEGDTLMTPATKRSLLGKLRRWSKLEGAVLLGCVLWTVYGRALDSPFVFDDLTSVVNNPSIVRVWPLFGDAQRPGPLNPSPGTSTSGRPLVNLSLALNYYFCGLDPTYYHVFNLVVHVLSVLLLWGTVERILKLECFGERFAGVAQPLAFL